MLRGVRFVLLCTLFTVVFGAVPAVAEECIEVPPVQFKHCI